MIDSTRLPLLTCHQMEGGRVVVTGDTVDAWQAEQARRCGHIHAPIMGCRTCRDADAVYAMVAVTGGCVVVPSQ